MGFLINKEQIMADPIKALDAALSPAKEVEDVTVYPITLARYALLELVKSPFVTASKDFTTIAMIPTIYICCAETSALKKYNSSNIDELKQDAITFADGIDPKKLGSLVKELDARVRQLLDVAPQIPEDGSVKKTEKAEQTE